MKYLVKGPQGGIATKIDLPDGFNPDKDKCTMIILMHGFTASKSMHPIPAMAKTLVRAGFGVIRFDFDAHGKSEGAFEEMTLSNEVADAQAVFDYVCTLPYVSEIAFAGHSQGGVIAGILAAKLELNPRRPVCLFLLAPAAVLKDDALKGICMGKKYDPANPPAYVSVMFGHHLGRKFILEAQKYPIYETSQQYTGNVCLVHGTSDSVVPVSYSEKYAANYKSAELHLIPRGGHFMFWKRRKMLKILSDFFKGEFA